MKLPCPALERFPIGLLVVAVWAGVSSGAVQESIYGVRIQTGVAVLLERVNTTSGAVATTVFPNFGPVGMRSLVCVSERLLTVSYLNNQPDRFTDIHPADAAWQYGLHTGFDQQCCISLDYDPTSSAYYYADGQSLYRVDPATGTSNLVGPFTGLSSSASGVTSFAIYPDGSAIAHGSGPMSLNAPVELYTLDLQTAALSQIPGVVVPNAFGAFEDLAVDSNGELWGSFAPVDSQFAAASGLYHINLANWTATHVRHVYPSYTGIAFVPDTQQTTYCVAKTNSLGCVPSISADGFPSPTAGSGYVLRAANVRNQTAGSLTFGIGGRAALPFGGGTNCIAPPRQRTPVAHSGGSPLGVADCSGTWQLDFNTWMSQYYTLPAGTTVQAQWFGRDLGFAAPSNWTLTDALEFTVRP
jgi:hypothetical protein